jgi:prepilin-type N-terminal cleavage/methylation domain-containing protein
MSVRKLACRGPERGYTLVELMMALALFAVAVVGIIAMQKITIVSNAHAKNVAMAQRIAQAWAGQLEMDATEWRTGFGSGWLNSANVWQRPAYLAGRQFGGAFDALGNPLKDDELGRAAFCTHVRMTWLFPDNMGTGGNGVLRAEIRVFWLKDGEVPLVATEGFCAAVQTRANDIGLATERYRFVYQTVGVRQHSQI